MDGSSRLSAAILAGTPKDAKRRKRNAVRRRIPQDASSLMEKESYDGGGRLFFPASINGCVDERNLHQHFGVRVLTSIGDF